MGSSRLLQLFPLTQGEYVVANLNCEAVGEDHEPRVPVELLVSNQRILAWHPQSPFALDLSDVHSIRLAERKIRIAFEGDLCLVHEAASKEHAAAFACALWSVRSGMIFGPSRPDWRSGVRALGQGSYDEALSLLSSAAALETCNCGVQLLLSAVQRLSAPERSAATIVCAAEMAAMPVASVLPLYVAETKLPFNEWHALKEGLSLDSQPLKDASVGKLLILLVDACRRGAGEDVAALATLIAQKSDKLDEVAQQGGRQFLGYFCRFRRDLCKVVAQHLQNSFVLRELAGALAALAADGGYPVVALRRLADVTGNAEPNLLANRIAGDWDSQIHGGSTAKQISDTVIEKSVSDPEVMISLLMQPGIRSLGRVGESLWAMLRSERRTDAFSLVNDRPAEWLQRQLATIPSDCPTAWISTLAATELLLSRGDSSRALDCLEAGYRDLLGAPPHSFDPYHNYAADLYEFYYGLARGDNRRAHLFADHLAGEHECFAWTNAVLTEFGNPRSVVFRTPDVERLLAWIASNRSLLGSDEELTRAHASLIAAVKTDSIRVVIGGETSAGKSSFINALIGIDLLFVTQEEATAIPTIVRNASDYRIRCFGSRGVLDELRFGSVLEKEELDEVRTFIRDYTFQSSPKSAHVARLEIGVPLDTLPSNIELIDTPGINGRDALSRIAEESIDSAHACVFLFDARNALKRSELRTIQFAATAVPKTIFVINKMDLVLGDDDLDCDSAAPDEVIDRVQGELSVVLGVAEVKVAAVSSVSPDRLRQSGAPPAAVAYAERVAPLRCTLVAMLEGSRQRLIEDLAARIATAVAHRSLTVALEKATGTLTQIARLAQELPPEPEVCRDEIERRVMNAWPFIRNQYLEALQQRIGTESNPIFESLDRAAQSCTNMDEVRRYVQSTVVNSATALLQVAEAARKSEWTKLTREVQQVVNEYFSALYNNLSFTTGVNELTVSLATPMPVADRLRDLAARAGDLSATAKAKKYGPAAVGAVIGTMIVPVVGSAAGFFFGKLLGDSWNAGGAQQLHESIAAYFRELGSKIWDCLVADVRGEDERLPPLLGGIFESIERERSRLEAAVRERISECQARLHSERLDSEKAITIACEAWDWQQGFKQRKTLSTNSSL